MNGLIDILPVALAVLFLFGARLAKPLGSVNGDYLSLDTSKQYRGLFALVIVFHHLSQKTGSGILFPFFSLVGYLAVSIFFFYSGYGLQKSFLLKADKYKNTFLLNRIPVILIPYVVFTIIYWIASRISGTAYSVSDVFAGLINGFPIVPYSWYMIVILVFYLFFWLFMVLSGQHPNRTILYGCIWYALWALFCLKTNTQSWWYNTAHLLIVGMIWAAYEKNISDFAGKHWRILAPVVLVCFILLFVLKDRIVSLLPFRSAVSWALTALTAFLFVCCVMLFSMKVQVGNRALGFLGSISLEIYLIHGLFINNLPIQNELVWCIAVIALSILSAWIIHLVVSGLLKAYKSLINKA